MKLKTGKKVDISKATEIVNKTISKSEKIRLLFLEGLSLANISKLLQIRYQFVNNVITLYLLRNPLEIEYERNCNEIVIIENQKVIEK